MTENTIFGTPLWHIPREETDYNVTETMKEWSLEWQKTDKGIKVSNQVNGYHSAGSENFNYLPCFYHLKDRLNFLPKFTFTSWWINIQNQGDYNASHNHPESDLSFIWYLTDNHNSLVFTKPDYEMTRRRLFMSFKNYNNNPFMLTWNWKCSAGDILVFPSDTLHHTLTHEKKELRISIAGNLNMII